MRVRSYTAGSARRAVVGAVVLAALAICCLVPVHRAPGSALLTFLLVGLISAGLAYIVRGAGMRTGALLGASAGMAAALGLVLQGGAGLTELFSLSAGFAIVLGGLGALAGTHSRHGDTPPLRNPTHARSERDSGQATGAIRPAEPELLVQLARLTDDFQGFLRGCTWEREWLEHTGWPEFERFLRQSVREVSGPCRVHAYHAALDPLHLRPLLDDPLHLGRGLPLDAVEIRECLNNGRAVDLPDGLSPPAARRPSCGPKDSAGGSDPAGERAGAVCLLPIRSGARVVGLVALERATGAASRDAREMELLRLQIELFWVYLLNGGGFDPVDRVDRATGILGRQELLRALTRLSDLTASGEPLVVLAFAIEGLRGLDDQGQWAVCDELITALGGVFRRQVRSEDIVGRLADDRFVVVLRRMDVRLGPLIAEKLLATIRADVLTPAAADLAPDSEFAASGVRLGVRVGLATTSGAEGALRKGTTSGTAESGTAAGGKRLLERALGLLEYARSQRIDLATDSMQGVPPGLTGSEGRRVLEAVVAV